MMRDSRVVAVALLMLAPLVWTAAWWGRPTEAAPPAQLELIQAAIYPGSCAAVGPEPVVRLNSFAGMDQASGGVPMLTSVTEVPVALVELLGADHAILVTLGRDRTAALACGDLAGPPEVNTISVELREQNDSGLAGVGLLVARGETTRISIILDESPPNVPVEPPRLPQATPVVTTPVTLEPPVTPTPTATPEADGVSGDTYTSQEFGYSVVIAPPWRLVDEPRVEPGTDYIVVTNGESIVDFVGIGRGLTALECIDTIYDYLLTRPGLSLLLPHTGGDVAVPMPERAVETWDIVRLDEQGRRVETTLYAQCLVLEPGRSFLVTTHESPTASYAAQARLRDELYQGMSLP